MEFPRRPERTCRSEKLAARESDIATMADGGKFDWPMSSFSKPTD
jgi:hypothetical protein